MIVLLHGLMATGEMFRWLAEPLESRFRLVIPDLPGHGRSASVPGPYTVDAMSARVAAALEALGVRDAHVMGYSHGGTVAQQLARHANHLVRSLALVATYAYNTATRRERVEGWLAPRLVRLLGMRRFARIVARPGAGGGPPLAPDQVAWLHGMLAGASHRRSPHRHDRRGRPHDDLDPPRPTRPDPHAVVGWHRPPPGQPNVTA